MEITRLWGAWAAILQGRRPVLSLEITTRCPLSCPGCYAYQPDHVDGAPLESFKDLSGRELVDGVLALVDRQKPMLVYIVGGEPLVRHRELTQILPELSRRGIYVEVVTSAVRPIPAELRGLEGVGLVVSIDGLQPEHDRRRQPATYERILEHIRGHSIAVHCTVTSQMLGRDDYLDEFARLWSGIPEVNGIRFSLYTPQIGEQSEEMLTPEMRRRVVAEMGRLDGAYPKVHVSPRILPAFLSPPGSPDECLFARVTDCRTADLETPVTPCQLGGNPDCTQCGCVASAGLHAVDEFRLAGLVRVGSLYEASTKVGSWVGQPGA